MKTGRLPLDTIDLPEPRPLSPDLLSCLKPSRIDVWLTRYRSTIFPGLAAGGGEGKAADPPRSNARLDVLGGRVRYAAAAGPSVWGQRPACLTRPTVAASAAAGSVSSRHPAGPAGGAHPHHDGSRLVVSKTAGTTRCQDRGRRSRLGLAACCSTPATSSIAASSGRTCSPWEARERAARGEKPPQFFLDTKEQPYLDARRTSRSS